MGLNFGGKKGRGYKVKRTNLEPGILGEACKDGTIYIDNSVPKGSPLEKKTIKHEAQHMKDMQSGNLSYGDNYVRHNSKSYHRKNGKIKYNGKWHEEGSDAFPWEKKAKKAE